VTLRSICLSLLAALVLGTGCYGDLVGTQDDDDAGSDDDDVAADDDDDATDDDDAADDDDDAADDDDDDTIPQGPVDCAPALTEFSLVSGVTQDVQLEASVEGEPATDVTWSVISGPGTVSASGLFTSSPIVGGEAIVQSWVNNEPGYCVVEMTMEGDQNETGDPGLPAGFDSATVLTDDACAGEILYPLADSAMPGSFAPPVIQWSTGGFSHHALELSSQWTTVTVYTTDDQYEPSFEQWHGLTINDPGDTVTLTLTSGTWNGSSFVGDVCTSTAATAVDVTDANLNGTIIYWAPPITKSISFDADSVPVNSTVAFASAVCHGCHTVNLGNPMRMTYGPGFPGSTALIDLSNPGTILQQWGGFFPLVDYGAPDNTGGYVVAGETGFSGSSLQLFDANTGAELGTIPTEKSPAMPNWSPDGTKLVYVGCDGGASALGAVDCDLYTQTWDAASETFSNETLIAARTAGETLYYPTFSPDSQWIAYNRAVQGIDAEGDTISSNSNPGAKVMLVSASGGTQINLSLASGVGDLTNSWPRWAPSAGGSAWLAWSSKRAYGHTVDGRAQLWVSQIDFSAAAAGDDASKPPVWLPGQLTSEGNHTPTWLPRFD
jgi:hypothetical protein